MDRSLISGAAPFGIVSFELAGSFERSNAILDSWSGPALSIALLLQGVDYLYLLIYPLWLSLAALSLASRLDGIWRSVGQGVSWVVLLAAPLDAIENYALIQQLLYGPSAELAVIARWCAWPKFLLVVIAALFIVCSVALLLLKVVMGDTDSEKARR